LSDHTSETGTPTGDPAIKPVRKRAPRAAKTARTRKPAAEGMDTGTAPSQPGLGLETAVPASITTEAPSVDTRDPALVNSSPETVPPASTDAPADAAKPWQQQPQAGTNPEAPQGTAPAWESRRERFKSLSEYCGKPSGIWGGGRRGACS